MNTKLTTAEMGRLSKDEYQEAAKIPLVAVLDNVRSQHNIGAVFRTADAMRIERVLLCGICCCPPNAEIHKTALGAEESVRWEYFSNTIDAIHSLRTQGYQIYAVEQTHGSMSLENFRSQLSTLNSQHSTLKCAVVFGHEVFGVQQEVIDLCDGCIEIPQYGTKHSLNVSVTAGIVLYSISNRLRTL